MNLSTARERLAQIDNLSELALRVGVNVRTLRRIKNSEAGARAGTLEALAKALRGFNARKRGLPAKDAA